VVNEFISPRIKVPDVTQSVQGDDVFSDAYQKGMHVGAEQKFSVGLDSPKAIARCRTRFPTLGDFNYDIPEGFVDAKSPFKKVNDDFLIGRSPLRIADYCNGAPKAEREDISDVHAASLP
jgi:hypothetical protein